MKKYIIPSLTVENFDSKDVIALSAIDSGEGGSLDWKEGLDA